MSPLRRAGSRRWLEAAYVPLNQRPLMAIQLRERAPVQTHVARHDFETVSTATRTILATKSPVPTWPPRRVFVEGGVV